MEIKTDRAKRVKSAGPDGPYSWVIVVAACIINTFFSGIGRATGIFYVALIDDYGIPRLQANLPFTLRYGIRNTAGPLVGVLGQRYGVRVVTIYGSILAIIGVILCSIAPNIVWISIFWGGLHGLGVALANTLFQVTVNQYFVKYRATASGIALSGGCIGSLLFPVILELFVKTYGLPGAFLLTAGLIMQVLPASIILTEPPWLKESVEKFSSDKKKEKKTKRLQPLQEMQVEQGATAFPDNNVPRKSFDKHKRTSLKEIGNSSHSELDEIDCNNRVNYKNGVENPTFLDSTTDIYKESKTSHKASTGEVDVSKISKTQDAAIEKVSIIRTLLNVCKNPMFHMISISLVSCAMMFDPLTIVIVDYIKDKGLGDNVGKYFISVLALGDLMGRTCFGWVTDKGYISLPKFMLVLQLISGICIVLLPLFNTFELLMCLIIIYGVIAGQIVVMFPVLVAHYLALEQSIAIGCIAFFSGIVTFSIAPLIGHFRDNEHSYDGMFYITGGMSIICCCLWLFEPFFVRCTNDCMNMREKKMNIRSSTDESIESGTVY